MFCSQKDLYTLRTLSEKLNSINNRNLLTTKVHSLTQVVKRISQSEIATALTPAPDTLALWMEVSCKTEHPAEWPELTIITSSAVNAVLPRVKLNQTKWTECAVLHFSNWYKVMKCSLYCELLWNTNIMKNSRVITMKFSLCISVEL